MHYVYNQYHLKKKQKQVAEGVAFQKKLAKSMGVF